MGKLLSECVVINAFKPGNGCFTIEPHIAGPCGVEIISYLDSEEEENILGDVDLSPQGITSIQAIHMLNWNTMIMIGIHSDYGGYSLMSLTLSTETIDHTLSITLDSKVHLPSYGGNVFCLTLTGHTTNSSTGMLASYWNDGNTRFINPITLVINSTFAGERTGFVDSNHVSNRSLDATSDANFYGAYEYMIQQTTGGNNVYLEDCSIPYYWSGGNKVYKSDAKFVIRYDSEGVRLDLGLIVMLTPLGTSETWYAFSSVQGTLIVQDHAGIHTWDRDNNYLEVLDSFGNVTTSDIYANTTLGLGAPLYKKDDYIFNNSLVKPTGDDMYLKHTPLTDITAPAEAIYLVPYEVVASVASGYGYTSSDLYFMCKTSNYAVTIVGETLSAPKVVAHDIAGHTHDFTIDDSYLYTVRFDSPIVGIDLISLL